MSRYGIYAIVLGANRLGGILSQEIKSNIEGKAKAANGQPYPYFSAVYAAKPEATFSTVHVKDALRLIPITGVNLASSALKMYAQEKPLGGTRSTSSFLSYTMNNGILYNSRLSCRTNADATLDARALLLSDPTGVNAWVVIGAETPAAIAVADDDKRYTLSAVTVAGLTLTGVTNVEIDFGVSAESEQSDSRIIPRFASINEIISRVTIDVLDVSLIQAAKFAWTPGTEQAYFAKLGSHANTSIEFVQREKGGGAAASGGFTIGTQGLCYVGTVASGSETQTKSGQVVIETIHDGTNAPITME